MHASLSQGFRHSSAKTAKPILTAWEVDQPQQETEKYVSEMASGDIQNYSVKVSLLSIIQHLSSSKVLI